MELESPPKHPRATRDPHTTLGNPAAQARGARPASNPLMGALRWLGAGLHRLIGPAFSASMPRALAETLVLALLLQGLALYWTRGFAPAPWSEVLAFAAEHAVWLIGVLRLRPSAGVELWRILRVPLFGALVGLGFAVLGAQLTRLIPPQRAFFEFQALTAPDPTQFLGTSFGALMLTSTLRFVFAYTYRAVWLEGRRFLRWRLTALALGGGVMASGLVAVLPGLVELLRDPARNLTGEAVRDARDLALVFTPTLQLGLDDFALRELIETLKQGVVRPSPRQIALDRDLDFLPAPTPGRISLALNPYGQVIASSDARRFPPGPLPDALLSAWADVLSANAAGRCRATLIGEEVFAGCPAFASPGRGGTRSIVPPTTSNPTLAERWVVAAVLRPVSLSNAPLADVVSQLASDLTRVLDTLSQGFLPIFIALGILGYLTARRLTVPLERLLDGSRSLEAGVLSVRVPIEGDDEITRLGSGFNAMANRLQRNIAALEREKANVESLLRANRRLTASASHELRTPLTVMRAHLESADMRDVPLGADEQRVLRAEVMRLERLVEDLFTLSRAELNQLELRFERVDLRDLSLTLVQSLRPVADASKITVLTALPAGMPFVRGDRERLAQALVNLLQNALKYTPEGGLVRLEASATATHVRISVQDTGIGIAQDDLERIFEPFYRTDASRARTTGGAGLGLTLVRELIEAMNGTIHAESEPGRGSRFSLELPIWTED